MVFKIRLIYLKSIKTYFAIVLKIPYFVSLLVNSFAMELEIQLAINRLIFPSKNTILRQTD